MKIALSKYSENIVYSDINFLCKDWLFSQSLPGKHLYLIKHIPHFNIYFIEKIY